MSEKNRWRADNIPAGTLVNGGESPQCPPRPPGGGHPPAPPPPPPQRYPLPVPPPPLNLAAAAAGWALPGLGHLLLGHTARGLILAVTICTLWLGGLLIGGISVIDRREHSAWFLGQMMLAPSLAVNRYHDHLRVRWQREVGTRSDLVAPFEPAFGKPQEQGTLFTAVAGLLNLLALIDVATRTPQRDGPP